jgi:hypothetical protein
MFPALHLLVVHMFLYSTSFFCLNALYVIININIITIIILVIIIIDIYSLLCSSILTYFYTDILSPLLLILHFPYFVQYFLSLILHTR